MFYFQLTARQPEKATREFLHATLFASHEDILPQLIQGLDGKTDLADFDFTRFHIYIDKSIWGMH